MGLFKGQIVRIKQEMTEASAREPLPTEDAAIVRVATEVCESLNVQDVPVWLGWENWRRGGRNGSSSRVMADDLDWGPAWLNLPKSMQGRLDAEEWRPLLASSLIFKHQLQGKLAANILVKVVLPVVALVSTLSYLLTPRLVPLVSQSLLGPLVTAFLPIVILVSILSSKLVKKSRLTADNYAAKLVGRDGFLTVLRKLASMNIPELERGRLNHPTIGQRIDNLESLQLPENQLSE